MYALIPGDIVPGTWGFSRPASALGPLKPSPTCFPVADSVVANIDMTVYESATPSGYEESQPDCASKARDQLPPCPHPRGVLGELFRGARASPVYCKRVRGIV